MLKNQGKVIGYKPRSKECNLDEDQLRSLNQIRLEMKNKSWDELFKLDEKGDDHRDVVRLTQQAFH